MRFLPKTCLLLAAFAAPSWTAAAQETPRTPTDAYAQALSAPAEPWVHDPTGATQAALDVLPGAAPQVDLVSGACAGTCGAYGACGTCGAGSACGGCPGCGGCGDLWTRQRMFGDYGGLAPKMIETGILADLQLTQFYQGVAAGGRSQEFEYGGKMDYMLMFEGAKLGINPGFTAFVHAETRYGNDVNFTASPLSLPNVNMLYPLPGSDETAITGAFFMQALNEEMAVVAGKLNTLDLWNMLFPNTGRGIEGFMNMSLVATPGIFRTTNLSVMGAGLFALEGKQIQGGVLVYDTNNSSTTSGFDDLFDQGAVVLGFWRLFNDWDGRPGSHTFLGNYSNRTYTSLDRTSWTFLPGEGLVAGQETGSWMLGYVFEQVVWQDRCTAGRNVSVMSTWTIEDSNPSPYGWTGNVAVQGRGLIRGRDRDVIGAGYFYDGLNSDFKRFLSPLLDLQDVHGGEVYYNMELAPWFHLTADMQVVNTENARNDTALFLGLRANLKL